ncbi:unnamed protein product [Bursaphelenchus okinawaensis]|uniref:Uncharacterized protein n=1 Tax=Bursaphelenchus okinawaensis TaxID=465554 RepID=A0A811LC92_9BILA|nr:unnamed protein product [Bursaphelenchus okinawaensis]CAG9121283.1 unnamed protein product [Bursaphelenchus okinawaensis]
MYNYYISVLVTVLCFTSTNGDFFGDIVDTGSEVIGDIGDTGKDVFNAVACAPCIGLVELFFWLLENSDTFYDLVDWACDQFTYGFICTVGLGSAGLASSVLTPHYICTSLIGSPVCMQIDKRSISDMFNGIGQQFDNFDQNENYGQRQNYNKNGRFDQNEDALAILSRVFNDSRPIYTKNQKEFQEILTMLPIQSLSDVKPAVDNFQKVWPAFRPEDQQDLIKMGHDFKQNVKNVPIAQSLDDLRRISHKYNGALDNMAQSNGHKPAQQDF